MWNSGTGGAFTSLALVTFLASLGTSIANIGLSEIARAFGAPFAEVQWVVVAYLLGITTLVVSAGRLGDRFGSRRLLLGGLALFTAASLACGAAPALVLLIGARAVQGAGAALMTALAMALVAEVVPRAGVGRAMGLLGTMSAVGTALGPSLGGALIAAAGWRALFLVEVPLGLLTLALAYRSLPLDPGEGRAAHPLIPEGTVRGRALWSGLAMSALASTVVMATLVVGPLYLAHGLGLPPARAGLVVSTGPLVAALVGAPAGVLVDRVGAGRVISAGLVALAAGCVALSSSAPAGGVAGYVAALVSLTAGYALFQAGNNTAVMTGVGPDRRGVVSGALNLSRNLGLITGASLMASLFTWAAGAGDPAAAEPASVVHGLRVTFAAAAVLAGAAGAWSIMRPTAEEPQPCPAAPPAAAPSSS